MANLLRVYRRFYRISIADDLTSSYTLIDPYFLTATVRNVSQGNVIIEASATTVNTLVGIYYADLSVSLYNTDDEYEIDWQVSYSALSPIKHLHTQFRFPDRAVSTGNVIRELDVELVNQPSLDVAVEKHTFNYSIEPNNP